MSRFLYPQYRTLEAYIPGEQPQDQSYIKLNTNELPFPPTPVILHYIREAQIYDLRLYCDPACRTLKKNLAAHLQVEPENLFISNGSDEALSFSFMAFLREGAAFADVTYGFYKVFCDLYGIPYRALPLNEDYSADMRGYLETDCHVVIANPNAPTGLLLPLGQIEQIVAANPNRLVIVDEAYIEFAAHNSSALPLTKRYDNLLVVQTFSKSYALAGARLGYAVGAKALISDLETIKYATNPYNVNTMTQLAGIAALEDQDFHHLCVNEVIRVREQFACDLRQLGFFVLPSQSNFVFAKHPSIGGQQLYQVLKERGILVRHFAKPRIQDFVRITIGSTENMQKLKQTLEEIV